MEIKLEGNEMTIKVALGAGVSSQSGKTLVVATTSGFQVVPGSDFKVSLNVIKPKR